MDTINIQFNDNEPLYMQLYKFLVDEIKNNNIKENEKLPSKKIASAHLKISQTTIETAYQMLLTEGYIISKPRSGYYICKIDNLEQISDFKPPIIEEEPQKKYTYNFSTNSINTEVFPFATWSKITKEVMYQNPQLLYPGHKQGDVCLRSSLLKYLHEFRGVNSNINQIIIGAGIEYLMDLLCQILGSDTVYALENPCYMKTYHIINNHQRKIIPINVASNGININDLEKSNANVVYITPSHQFPMGVTMPVGNRISLLKWANKSDERYIIEDDYDSEFRYSGRPIPALQGLDKNEKVIYIGTFSRIIAPSVRIAYMILPPELLKKYKKYFGDYSSTVSRFEQHTLNKFIENGHLARHLNKARNIYKQQKELLVSALKNRFGNAIKIHGENAGLHFLLEVNNNMSELQLVESAKKYEIKVTGLSAYNIVPLPPKPIVVLGYAGMTNKEIIDSVNLLYKAWI